MESDLRSEVKDKNCIELVVYVCHPDELVQVQACRVDEEPRKKIDAEKTDSPKKVNSCSNLRTSYE